MTFEVLGVEFEIWNTEYEIFEVLGLEFEIWNTKYGKNLKSHRGTDCEPRFDKDPFYEHTISGQMDAGDVKDFVVGAGTKVFVNGARGYEVTYKLHTPPGGNDEQIKNWFDVDASTGQIILKKARDHPFPFRALWQIVLPPTGGVAAIYHRPLGG